MVFWSDDLASYLAMKKLSLSSLAFSFSLCLGAASAEVLDVRGPTPDYNEILAAVQAAADGDVIRIWPGEYSSFSVQNKSLTLVPATDAGEIQVLGLIRIQNVGAGKTVALTGIDCEGVDGPGMLIAGCQGSVRIRDAKIEGVDGVDSPDFEAFYALRAVNSADIVIANSTLIAGETTWFDYTQFGADGLWSQSSVLSLFDCTVEAKHGRTEDDPGESGGPGGDAIVAWGNGSKLYVSGSTLLGGNGSSADPDISLLTGMYGCGGDGGDGIDEGQGVESFVLDCVIVPGTGGWAPQGCFGFPGVESHVAEYRPGPTRLLDSSPWVHDTEPIQLDLQGASGANAWLAVSTDTDLVFNSVKGPLLIESASFPAAQQWLNLGTLDASGILSATIMPRDLLPGDHVTLHLQALMAGSATRRSSSAWTVVIGT